MIAQLCAGELPSGAVHDQGIGATLRIVNSNDICDASSSFANPPRQTLGSFDHGCRAARPPTR